MSAIYFEETCQLRGNSIIIYSKPHYDKLKSSMSSQQRAVWKLLQQQRLKNSMNKKETYSGSLTQGTKKRMTRAISMLLQASISRVVFNPCTRKNEKFLLNFLTLTIPLQEKNVDLKTGYKTLLKPFLQWLYKTQGVRSYIWKAERTKKGELHYHITTNHFIHKAALQNKWNYLLTKNNLLDRYIKKHKHSNAPSTRVNKVYKIRDLQSYLTKEFTKAYQNNHNCKGKIWDCSINLKGVKYFEVPLSEFHERKLFFYDKNLKLWEVNTEHCTILKCQKQWSSSILTATELNSYRNLLKQIRNEQTTLFN